MPPPTAPKGKLEPVDLSLVVAEVKGTLYVGAYTWARNGCGSLVGEVREGHIEIAGMFYPKNAICTQALVPHWEAIPVGYGDTTIVVDDRGKRGFYEVHQETKRVTIDFLGGKDVAPPASNEGWWRVPADILIAHVWYGKPEAIKRVSDRVHERLLDEGSKVFDTPEGFAIPTEPSAKWAPHDNGSGLAEGYTEDLQPDSRTRIYLSTLGPRRLRRIAHEEAQRERCTFIVFHHEPYEAGGIFGRPPCDRD